MQSTVQGSDREDLIEGSVGDLANRIYHSTHRLSEVVNDILNIALIEADEMHLEYGQVDLVQAAHQALGELNPSKNGRNLNIRLETLDTLPPLIGDQERLQQVFWNSVEQCHKIYPGWRVDLGQRV